MTATAYIALGTNIGDRAGFLQDALAKLDQNQAFFVQKTSSIYETDPIGYTNQQDFLNMVVVILTHLSPHELLERLQDIEKNLGRTREIRWGPRTIDLDILLYNHLNINTEALQIPHPRMLERGFVMIPLYEINPDLKIPGSNHDLKTIIEQISDKEGVRLWRQNCGEEKFGLFES